MMARYAKAIFREETICPCSDIIAELESDVAALSVHAGVLDDGSR